MASIYYPTGTNVYTRIVGGTNLSELHIDTSPDTIFVLTGSYPYTSSIVFIQAMDTSSSYPITASYTLTYLISSSIADLALTASYASTSSYAVTASYASTSSYVATASAASVLLPFVPTYGVTASFDPSSSISQGQLIFRLLPISSSYTDAGGGVLATTNGQIVRYIKDISGLGRHCWMHIGTAGITANKYSLILNTGVNGGNAAMWSEAGTAGMGAYSDAFAAPTYPLWFFFVGKVNPVSSVSVGIFDGIGSGTRSSLWVGTTPQLYAGANFNGAITGSITGSISTGKWFLQSFKNNLGAGCLCRTNGTQSLVPGNASTQTIGGYTIGGDYTQAGGATYFLEFLIYSNITNADAFSIEDYLLAKYKILTQ